MTELRRPTNSAIGSATVGSPHTPNRVIPSAYGSPSALRADEDYVVIELGSRIFRAGFAGDALPKAVIRYGPDGQRRAGDYRRWQPLQEQPSSEKKHGSEAEKDHELWNQDLRDIDLGFVGDKLERVMKEAYTKYLLIDSRPRKIMLALPTMLPMPLLSTVLDTLFNAFQAPTISLMAEPALTTVAAGLRSALIVDIGWEETVVTAVVEYREVMCRRSIRAGKHLQNEMQKVLEHASYKADTPTASVKIPAASRTEASGAVPDCISFEDCEEIVERLAWCKPFRVDGIAYESTDALSTVKEEDELQPSSANSKAMHDDTISIPLTSTLPARNLNLQFSSLAEPCETSYFGRSKDEHIFDDEELPIHWLVYTSLLKLPVDQRAICMARLILTGGGSNLPGLKDRVSDEVQQFIDTRGWSPVKGKAVGKFESNPKLNTSRSRQFNYPHQAVSLEATTTSQAMDLLQESDPIEARIRAETSKTPMSPHGVLRVVESMGAWAGASLLAQLRVPAISIVEREQWLLYGAAGAAKSGEVTNTSVRQSIGPSALRAGNADRSSWTLGPWG